MKLPIGTELDPRFSRKLPGMQLQVNSSSLGPFKQCPRKYYYTIVTGLETAERSIHLTFGTLVHKASDSNAFHVGFMMGSSFCSCTGTRYS